MWKACVRVVLMFLFLGSFWFPVAYADRGMISIAPGVSVFEPGQKAVVAWDGHEEILILSTDVSASAETLVLEILPLPSYPVVEAASFQSFQQIQDMIWTEGWFSGLFSSYSKSRSGSVEVVFQELIGAHNITVVMASVASDLVDWANGFLSASGVDQEVALGNFESVVDDYMSRGFRYYVLDLITFSSEERSVDAVLYRFDSSTLYYPLLITSPLGGDGEITLFTLTEEKLTGDYQPLRLATYQLDGGQSQPIQFLLSRGDLSRIDLRISEMLPDGAWLSVLQYEGNLGYLDTDLMMSESSFTPSAGSPQTVVIEMPNGVVEMPYGVLALFFVLGALSVLLGVGTAILIFHLSRKK